MDIEGVPIFILKTANADNGHYGEMAGGQPFIPISSHAEL